MEKEDTHIRSLSSRRKSKLNVFVYLQKNAKQAANPSLSQIAKSVEREADNQFINSSKATSVGQIKKDLQKPPNKKRAPLKNQIFKHAKLIPLAQRYTDRTPRPIALENESDAEIEALDLNFDLRRMNHAPKQTITTNLDKNKITKTRN